MQKVCDAFSYLNTNTNMSFCRSPSVKLTRVRHDNSTSNLVRHVKSCEGSTAVGAGSLREFAHGSTYTPHEFRMKIALWVARRHRPFAIVEDEELVDIFKLLNNKVNVPSRVTVSRDVTEIFEISRKQVANILKVHAHCTRFLTGPDFNFERDHRHIKGNYTSALMVGPRQM